MGQDYAQRKNAKKAWKKVGAKGAEKALMADKAARRVRKQRKSRRLCQGVCWKDPQLTEEDKKWNGKIDDDDDDEEMAQVDSDIEAEIEAEKARESSAAAAAAAAAEIDDKSAKKKKKKEKAPKKEKDEDGAAAVSSAHVVRLSTGVHLLDPELAAKQARDKAASQASAEGGQVVEAAALAPYPQLIRSFMLSHSFAEPTPIQEAAWPALCEGRDMLGVAEPGSGKTLAYLLPAAVRLQALGHTASTSPASPPMLVLVPTRELALQVAGTCRELRSLCGLRTVCLYGGVPKEQQVELLNKKPHILVCTPGRLLDLADDGLVVIQPPSSTSTTDADGSPAPPDGMQVVVLDEADKMLSLGFQPQLNRLYGMLFPEPTKEPGSSKVSKGSKGVKKAAGPKRPQVLLFTATTPEEVNTATQEWLQPGAERVVITHSAASISKTITQVVQVCAEHKKPAKLLKHLAAIKAKSTAMRNPPRVLVFANRIKTVRYLHDTLAKEGYRTVMLHGQRSQPERDEAMKNFRSGKSQVMVATDVAARGLDVRLLPYVVNYDFPGSLATYIHRVGRTGRLAAYGHSYSFFTRNLARLAAPLIDLLRQHDQALDPNLIQLAETWKEAEAKLGPEGLAAAARKLESMAESVDGEQGDDEDDDEGDRHRGVEDHQADQMLEVEDLLEGLGRSANKKNKKASKKRAHTEVEEENGQPPSFQQRLQKQKVVGQAVAQVQASVQGDRRPFVASKVFAGARSGYVFKKGPEGLGYYVDNPPKKLGKATLQQLTQKGKGPIVPIGPQHTSKRKGASKFDSSSDEEEEAAPPAKASKGSVKQAPKATGSGNAAGGDDDSDKPAGGTKAAAAAGSKGKPLPGRLRKKLAKERAAAAAGQ